jgi:8-oxo-dGTP pyrophosphatase MutT (NUDIX family)
MQKFFFAQKAFIVNKGAVLLVRKSADDPNQAGKWEVPGGRMDFGEDVDPHLSREVREEVGLDVEPGPPFYLWQWQLSRQSKEGEPLEIQIVAVARVCRPKSTVISTENRVEEDYLDEVEWVPFERILTYDLIENMYPVVDAFLQLPDIRTERL